jgi:hypothetical protein
LQTGLFRTVFKVDDRGAGVAEEITQRIRNTETFRLFVASSPNPLPVDSPDTGSFTLTITVEKEKPEQKER